MNGRLRNLIRRSSTHETQNLTQSDLGWGLSLHEIPERELGKVLALSRRSVQKHLSSTIFPRPSTGDPTSRIWAAGDLAQYASEQGLRFTQYLPGSAPTPGNARWTWHTRLAFDGRQTHIGPPHNFSAVADIFTPTQRLAAATTAGALAWITPIWPATTSALSADPATLLAALTETMPSWTEREHIRMPVTVVLAPFEGRTISASQDWLLVTEALLDSADPLASRQAVFEAILNTQQMPHLIGVTVPFWPSGSNLAHHVRSHVWGAATQVPDSPRFEHYRTAFSHAVNRYKTTGSADFATLAVLLESSYAAETGLSSTLRNPPQGTYKAAHFPPLPLPPDLPSDGCLFTAVNRVHSDVSVEDTIATSIRAIFGDPGYGALARFPLRLVEPDHREKITQTIRQAALSGPFSPRARWFRSEVQAHTGKKPRVSCVMAKAPWRPTLATIANDELFWLPPMLLHDEQIATWSTALGEVEDFLLLAVPMGPNATYPVAWAFEPSGRAMPLPAPRQPAHMAEDLMELLCGRPLQQGEDTTDPLVALLNAHMTVQGRQVSFSRAELTNAARSRAHKNG